MNVLFVNKVSPELGGGAETRILEIGKRLVERGCKVHVLCATTRPAIHVSKKTNGIDTIFARTCPDFMLKNEPVGFYAPRLFFYLKPLNELQRIITENRVDVIVEDVSPTLNPWVSRIAEKNTIPLVYSIHEVFEDMPSWIRFYGIAGLWGYFFERRIRQRKLYYQKIITVAEWVKRSLARDIPQDLIDVITNGVDLDKFKPTEKSRSEGGNILLLNVGRFVPHKGHIFLLKAVKAVLSVHESLELRLVGTGPLLLRMRKIAHELGIDQHVVFHGYVTETQLLNLYSKADIFVFPSIYEGFPVVIPEAMAMRLPIVSTKIRAVEGVLDEHNAVMVDPADSSALAAGILKIIEDDKLRNKLSALVGKEALERFDWEQISDLYLSRLSSLVG